MNKNGKYGAIVEARMTSNRLPGKVMLPLAGKPSIVRLCERLKASKVIDEVIVAATINQTDDILVVECEKNNISFYRGSEDDVLSRVLEAAHKFEIDNIIQITGDCPLVDPNLVELVYSEYNESDCEYMALPSIRYFPDGMDVGIFATSSLERCDKLTSDPVDRIHVSYYMYTHQDEFNFKISSPGGRAARTDLRLTLDEQKDYELISIIYDNLYSEKKVFSYEDIIRFLDDNPELKKINQSITAKNPEEG